MQKKRTPSLTDQRLRQLLKQLREEPAAPQDFRDKVMQRLQQEGVLAAPPAPAQPSFGERLAAFWRPAGFGLAAAGAMALLLLLRIPSAPMVVASSPAAPAAAAVKAPAAVAARHRAPAFAAAPAPAAAEPEHGFVAAPQTFNAAPALGAAAPAPVAVDQVHAASTNVTPSPTTVSKDPNYQLSSQVWNNVIHASRGEAAEVRFTFKTSGPVRIDIIDRTGRVVAVLQDGVLASGIYTAQEFTWRGAADAGGLAPSGIYQLRIRTPDYREAHKLMLVK
jgi:hypothetical protein